MSEELFSELTIYQRMSWILAELPAIGKAQRNEQQNFMYRGHDDVLNALNPLLAKYGVVIIPRVLERTSDRRQTKSGTVMYEVNLHVSYIFFGAKGDYVEASAWGEGTDSGDKSTNKAMTMAFKNVLAQSFAISTAENQDSDAGTPEETVFENAEQLAAKSALTQVLDQLAETDLDGAHSRDYWQQVAVRAANRDYRKPIEALGTVELTKLTHQFDLALAALREKMGAEVAAAPPPDHEELSSSPEDVQSLPEEHSLPIEETVEIRDPAPLAAPTSWAEVEQYMRAYGDATWEHFQAFAAQARSHLFPDLQRLSADKKNLLLQKAATVVINLRESHDPNEMPPPNRIEFQAHWAKVLEGKVLTGPPSRMSPDDIPPGQADEGNGAREMDARAAELAKTEG